MEESSSSSNADRASGTGGDSGIPISDFDPGFDPGEKDRRLKGREKRE